MSEFLSSLRDSTKKLALSLVAILAGLLIAIVVAILFIR